MNSSAGSVVEQVDRLLDAVSPAVRLGDDELRARVVECEQAAQMLAAIQADAMVQMGRRARAADRAEVTDRGEPMWSRECREEFVPDEIAMLLSWTKMAAAARYETACRAAEYPSVGKAWRAGRVDARTVGVIGEQVSVLPTATAQSVATAAVQFATEPGRVRTVPQVRQWLRRKVITIDPDAAEVRRRRALADRRVVITGGDDGMAELWALLPGVQAWQIQQALTTAAQRMGAGDDDSARSMDQRRADTLVDLLLGRADPPQVSLQLIASADTITGASNQPGWVPGLGPVTAIEVSELVGSGRGAESATDTGTGLGAHVTVQRLLTDPATGTLTDLSENRYRPHLRCQPRGPVPPPPPPQTHRRMEREPPPHRRHDLDNPHRTDVAHRTLAVHQPRPTESIVIPALAP